ncbi:MAG: PAC2 family protein [Actinomycetia bacterium]|nr:PAC2 family protein [Actinomycetes bacterium]
MNVLTTAFEDLGKLNRPIMVLALRGWFDIAEVATDAVETLAADRITPVVAAIDPDPFFDFTQERPHVAFDDDEERQIHWPENEFRVARFPGCAHDLVLLAGVEPHLRYATFADAIIEVATALGCEVVVTVGAAPEAVPHSRPPQVTGSSTTVGLARALGLGRPKYQGVTGLVGVLQERLDRAGIPGRLIARGRAALPRQRQASAIVGGTVGPPGTRARHLGSTWLAGRGRNALARPTRRGGCRG